MKRQQSMRTTWVGVASILIALALTSLALAYTAEGKRAPGEDPAVPGEILVKLHGDAKKGPAVNWLKQNPYPVVSRLEALGVYVLSVPPESQTDILKDLSTDPAVEFVEPNRQVPHQDETGEGLIPLPGAVVDSAERPDAGSLLAQPNDPLFSPYQWSLHNTGQTICYGSGSTSLVCYNNLTEDADIDAPEAWDIHTGARVRIAVLSTGVEADHPDLAGKIAEGGYDFANEDEDPADDNWRGTFQAGIGAAMTNNGRDVAGVSWGAEIVPIKVLDSAGDGDWAAVASGVIRAADLGAPIIYIGTAGSSYSQTMAEAVAYAQSKGSLIIAPGHLRYPAAYDGVVGVSATNFNDQHTNWTGSGDYIDVAAPGSLIASTVWRGADENGRAISSNTPAAAAHVAGLAALVKSVHPAFNAHQIADVIFTSADDLGEPGWDPKYGHGRINAYRALSGAEPAATITPPLPPATATATLPPSTFTPPPPPAGGSTISIVPYGSAVGWVRQADRQGNHFGDDDTYTGIGNGYVYHGAVQFDLSQLPIQARITAASIELTGQTWTPPERPGVGSWRLDLLEPAIDGGWAGRTFSDIRNARSVASVGAPVPAHELGPGRVNVFELDATSLRLLEERLQTTRRASFRLSGPEDSAGTNLFSWNSGYGVESTGRAPTLRVTYTLDGVRPSPTPSPGPTPTPTTCTGTWIQGGEVVLGCVGSNGRVLGRVFFDVDGDGARQAATGEYGVSGAVLVLRNALGNIVGTATTDGEGYFEFLGLRADHYTLEEINPQDYPGDTTPNLVTISPGDFVHCCTVSVAFGDDKASPPAPPPSTPTPTATLAPIGTPPPSASGQPGPGRRIQLPAIDNMGEDETWIQVQNLGHRPSKVILFTWGDYSYTCPPQAPGPLKVECSGLLVGGAAWTFRDTQLPSAARSVIAYSVPADTADEACADAFDTVGLHGAWRLWESQWRAGFYGIGERLAVSVNRRLVQDNGVAVASAYTGISENMLGVYDPVFGGFMYYVPVLYNKDGWDSEIVVQNSGNECTSLEVWYKTQDDCLRSEIHSVPVLSPGESVRLKPTGLPIGRRGSAWIRASQPLAIVVDQLGNDTLMTSRGVPADSFSAGFSAGSLVNFAPLIYREYNGWGTRIHVQNLSSTVNAKVKVYFLDEGGDIIQTVLDWICPRGSQTYELETIGNLPGRYVGAVRIESQNWWTPGDPPVDAPNIVSVVSLVNAFEGQALSYNAFTQQEAQGVRTVALPLLTKQNGRFGPGDVQWSTEIAVQNINMNPGSTSFRVDIYDPNGLVETFCQFVSERQVDYVDLDKIGTLPQGFTGSAVIDTACSDQAGGASIVAVGIERASGAGDFTKAFEGVRLDEAGYFPSNVPVCPGCDTP